MNHSRSLHVTQVIPTPNHGIDALGTDPPTVQWSSSPASPDNSSSDDLEYDIDTASTAFEGGDHSGGGGGQFQYRNERNYQSYRLNSNSLRTQLQLDVVQVTPNHYASFRLHLSEW